MRSTSRVSSRPSAWATATIARSINAALLSIPPVDPLRGSNQFSGVRAGLDQPVHGRSTAAGMAPFVALVPMGKRLIGNRLAEKFAKRVPAFAAVPAQLNQGVVPTVVAEIGAHGLVVLLVEVDVLLPSAEGTVEPVGETLSPEELARARMLANAVVPDVRSPAGCQHELRVIAEMTMQLPEDERVGEVAEGVVPRRLGENTAQIARSDLLQQRSAVRSADAVSQHLKRALQGRRARLTQTDTEYLWMLHAFPRQTLIFRAGSYCWGTPPATRSSRRGAKGRAREAKGRARGGQRACLRRQGPRRFPGIASFGSHFVGRVPG